MFIYVVSVTPQRSFNDVQSTNCLINEITFVNDHPVNIYIYNLNNEIRLRQISAKFLPRILPSYRQNDNMILLLTILTKNIVVLVNTFKAGRR